ncbi:Transient receptor potential cation channel subfamily M member 6 [Nymphon striatum]|nr:Transient receptor potential cation channel subfamily M member 6 [Nymphon striatum]
MANKWKNFPTAMKEKRSGKRKQPDILSKEEIVIQRLSAEVSGKAQKYSRKQRKVLAPLSLPATKAQSPSKAFPKSLSVLEMLKLEKVISEKTSENIELSSFELCKMAWCTPLITEFSIAKKPVGKGGFREAFTATSDSPGIPGKDMDDAIKIIKETNQTTEQHTKIVVQMHMLARNFALKLTDKLKKDDSIDDYGDTLSYKKIYLGKIKYEDREPEWVTVEEFIDGKFSKYINNNGVSCGTDSVIRRKCESLAHFSYEHSNGQLMVVDMQGSNHELFDPEIASRGLLDDGEVLFSTGNLSKAAINNFVDQHQSSTRTCARQGVFASSITPSESNSSTFSVMNS